MIWQKEFAMSRIFFLMLAIATFVGADLCAAREAATVSELNLRTRRGSGYELLVTVPVKASVSVGQCQQGWCEFAWQNHAAYSRRNGLVLRKIASSDVVIPVFPNYPYRAGYYPKADWYFDLPPYAATLPSFHRRRYFMMAQERNRYRYMPHVFP